MAADTRILLLAGSTALLDQVVDVLARSGVAVTPRLVSSEAALAAALNAGPWDLAIAEHAMAGAGAAEALTALPGRVPGVPGVRTVPLIIISAPADDALAVQAIKAGAYDYLFEGNLLRLGACVERALREAREGQPQGSGSSAAGGSMAGAAGVAGKEEPTLGDAVSALAHALKTPLVTMEGYLGLLAKEAGDGTGGLMALVEPAARAAGHMRRQIDGLSEWGRAKPTGQALVDLEVEAVVRGVLENLGPAIAERSVEVEVAGPLPKVRADPALLARAFENLILNAIRHGCSAQRPKVVIGGVRCDAEVRYFVSDNGPGIPEACHRRAFGLFQRFDTTHNGAGLGLATVKRIAESHGGRAWLESALTPSPASGGGGATFWLAFPADERGRLGTAA